MDAELEALVFGKRLRHFRRRRGFTLRTLGEAVGRPASYLSQLENGVREPRLSTVKQLAAVLGCSPSELLAAQTPDRRAELEVALARMQGDPRYQALRLPHLRPSRRLDDVALEHVVVLFEQLRDCAETSLERADAPGDGRDVGARAANAAMRHEMRRRDNYFEDIEHAAERALGAVSYGGTGAVSERDLTDLSRHFGFTVARVQDLPASTRSITDTRRRTIYVPQRNNATTRAVRSVIAQTLGRFALGHRDPVDFEDYVRQRVEANLFAGALLAPERAVVACLVDAKGRRDISVEDLKELFYISYEMAAHRLTNLITHHLEIPVHFLRSDPDGFVWKAYENDGLPMPSDDDGTIEGRRVCRFWGARQAFASEDSYSMHYQYTTTPSGTYWCATHLELSPERGDAVTVGTTERYARWFRGADSPRLTTSRCPDPSCCRRPRPEATRRWEGVAWPSAQDHSHFVSGLPTDTVTFSPYPGVELVDVYAFLDRHSEERRGAASNSEQVV